MDFTILGAQVFEGLATVAKGRFSSTFVIPKDINLDVDAARISFIAFNRDKTESVGGFSNQFNIGGINTTTESDTQGPTIVDVYLREQKFCRRRIRSSIAQCLSSILKMKMASIRLVDWDTISSLRWTTIKRALMC